MHTIKSLQEYNLLQITIAQSIAMEYKISNMELLLIDSNFAKAMHHVIYDTCHVTYCKKEKTVISNEVKNIINKYSLTKQKVESILSNNIL
jgi:UDP-glucose 4-epimerase